MANDLDSLSRDLMLAAQKLDKGKHAKKFLRKEGAKLNKENKKQAKSCVIGRKTGNFMKGFKKGKVYKYKGQELSIRAYNSSKHAHLLDLGHRKISHGNEVGFTEGFHFMEKAKNAFGEEYVKDSEEFIDLLLRESDL